MISDKLVQKVQRYMQGDSPAWEALEEYLHAAIQDRRVELENPKLDTTETSLKRGEIKALKELLALPLAVTQVTQSDPGYSVTGNSDFD